MPAVKSAARRGLSGAARFAVHLGAVALLGSLVVAPSGPAAAGPGARATAGSATADPVPGPGATNAPLVDLLDPDWPSAGDPDGPLDPAWPSADDGDEGPVDVRPLPRPPALSGQQAVASALPLSKVRTTAFPLYALPWERRYVSDRVVRDFPKLGKSGVCVDKRTNPPRPHPVAAARCGEVMWNNYRLTKDPAWLAKAVKQANWLISYKQVHGGGWFYPYLWDHALGASATKKRIVLKKPWYSAMAQGQALGLFARLAESTGHAKWRTAANRTFTSLLVSPSAKRPWASWVHNRYLWLEETTFTGTTGGARIFNGHMFALFGVYDYWRLTNNPKAAQLLRAALTTTLAFGTKLRRPGWRSYYDDHRRGDSRKYHYTHVYQLLYLAEMTGDIRFNRVALRLWSDAQPELRTGTMVLRGRVKAYRFKGGRPVLARTVTLPRASSAPLAWRYRIAGTPQMWLRPRVGGFAGLFVPEAGSAYVRGLVAELPIRRPLTVSTRGTKLRYYTYDARTGGMTAGTDAPTRRGAGVVVDRFAIIGGVVHYRVAGGPFRERWVAAGQVAM